MPADRTDLKVGVFVVLALTIFAIGTLWIVGRWPLTGNRVSYEVLMKSSGGVRSGDGVRLSGVQVGRVKGVNLQPGDEWPVVFEVSLDKSIRLSSDSSARIASDGLLGAYYLEIITGRVVDTPLPPGSRIEGSAATDPLDKINEIAVTATALIDQTTQVLSAISNRLEPILAAAERLLSDQNVDNVGQAMSGLRTLVGDTESRLPELLERLDAVAGQLEGGLEGLPEVRQQVSTLVADLSRAIGPDGERLGETLDAATATLHSANGALGTVQDGSAGLEALVRDLRAAAANLRSLTTLLQERPAMLLRKPRLPDVQPGQEPKP